MSMGEPLPKQIFGHPWLLFGADKMSKSKGNVIYADELVQRFGVDGVRYYVLREMPFASDGNITYETMIARYNGDLANTVGNLVNRTIAMGKKYFGGVLQPAGVTGGEAANQALDTDLIQTALQTVKNVEAKMEELRVADALEEIVNLARRSNKYIDETAPWALAKDEAQKERLGTVLYNLLESIRYIGVLLGSFLPETGEAILNQVNVPAEGRSLESLATFGLLQAGAETNEATPLFARIDEKKMLAEIEAEKAAKAKAAKEAEKAAKKAAAEAAKAAAEAEKEEPETKSEITIDDFTKVELKVGEVLECQPVEGAKKLLVSQIKIGDEVRQIVSGIASYYKPEEMVGKKVVVVTNLKPVKLRGVLSQGMILCASDENGNFAVISPEKDMPSGGEVR